MIFRRRKPIPAPPYAYPGNECTLRFKSGGDQYSTWHHCALVADHPGWHHQSLQGGWCSEEAVNRIPHEWGNPRWTLYRPDEYVI